MIHKCFVQVSKWFGLGKTAASMISSFHEIGRYQ